MPSLTAARELRVGKCSGTKVTNLVQDISSASKHQARNVSEINLGLVQMNEITQQNALMAEESSEASLNLTAESENLKDTISRFKLVTKGAA